MEKEKGIQTESTEQEMVDIPKQCKNYLYDLLFHHENPEMENIEESYEEEVARKPSLEGRLEERDQKITLESYPQERHTKMKSISFALIFKHYRAIHIIRSIERASLQVESGDLHKTCECYPNH